MTTIKAKRGFRNFFLERFYCDMHMQEWYSFLATSKAITYKLFKMSMKHILIFFCSLNLELVIKYYQLKEEEG